MPTRAAYKRGYKAGKSKGKDTTVWCEGCGRKFPRHKAFLGRKSFRIFDPALSRIIDRSQVEVEQYKVYYCPKCARYLGIVEPSGRRAEIRAIKPILAKSRLTAGDIVTFYVPEILYRGGSYTIGVSVRNKSASHGRFVVLPGTIIHGLGISPNEKRIFLKAGGSDAVAFALQVRPEALENERVPISFNLKSEDGRIFDSKIKYISIKTPEVMPIEAVKEITILKQIDKADIELNKVANVTLTAVNPENIELVSVAIADHIPEIFKLVNGKNVWTGKLKPGKSKQITYRIKATAAGAFELPPAVLTYEDEKGNKKELRSKPIKIQVSQPQPKIILPTIYAMYNPDGKLTLVNLQNIGRDLAKEVNAKIILTPLSGELIEAEGRARARDIRPESSLEIKFELPELKDLFYPFELKVNYQSEDGVQYSEAFNGYMLYDISAKVSAYTKFLQGDNAQLKPYVMLKTSAIKETNQIVESFYKVVTEGTVYTETTEGIEPQGLLMRIISPLKKRPVASCFDRSFLLASLLNAKGQSARVIMGYILNGRWTKHAWVEVHYGNRWIPLETTLSAKELHRQLTKSVYEDGKYLPVIALQRDASTQWNLKTRFHERFEESIKRLKSEIK
ncbi:MAG: BatD family protein [Euryarchaeota archaeon]|nr:BatD family protein [Euryarchaeota archaeon]